MKKFYKYIFGILGCLIALTVSAEPNSIAVGNNATVVNGYQAYLGNWINKSPGSLLKKLAISQVGNTIEIEAWGHCAKTSGICDWGKIYINSQYPHGYEPWNAKTANAVLSIRPLGQNQIQVAIDGFFPQLSSSQRQGHPTLSILQRATPVPLSASV